MRETARAGARYQKYSQGRFAQDFARGSDYSSPGWRRAQADSDMRTKPPAYETHAELVATADPSAASYGEGERVFHQKFGYGHVAEIDGNKLTVDFDKAGRKKVIDSFLERA